ncbi:MAG TPA: TetR/AcrR family transcriptional regulator [Acidimicrobiales bacterium]|nr:TetR/AcrR family transcriptional regulator [Acidimicrobiales bacterium]
MSAPRTARERVREEMTAEILAVARRHVAEQGAAALSLRSVARDLEMAPSALYRYFDGRDALLSALILDAYESLATEAERAAAEAQGRPGGDLEHWSAVPRALRGWALAHPHEWGLIFGAPVPGYHAPETTIEPYARIATALMRPVADALAAGRLTEPDGPAPAELRAAVAPVAEGLFPELEGDALPTATVVHMVGAFSTLVGVVSLEVFGHWRNTILDPAVFFEATLRDLGAAVGLTSLDS